jgi:hypothetical protein
MKKLESALYWMLVSVLAASIWWACWGYKL